MNKELTFRQYENIFMVCVALVLVCDLTNMVRYFLRHGQRHIYCAIGPNVIADFNTTSAIYVCEVWFTNCVTPFSVVRTNKWSAAGY